MTRLPRLQIIKGWIGERGDAPEAGCRRIWLREGRSGAGGFSVVELLLATVLGALVLGAGLSLFQMHGGVARAAQATLGAVGGAAWAMDVVARDLELAGASPAASPLEGIASASSSRIVLQSDLDGDGIIDAASAERVTLAWSASSGGRLVRWLGSQSIALAGTVTRAGFALRYFDRAGAELLPPAGGSLDATQRQQVQRVLVRLEVAEPVGGDVKRVRLETTAALRNRVPGGAP